MKYPLHSLSHSLTQFISDELVPAVYAAADGKAKDLADKTAGILAIERIEGFIATLNTTANTLDT